MSERDDLIEALTAHRGFLRHTVQGITDEQARQRLTVSELTLGGLIKHVAKTEEGWAKFIVDGPQTMAMTENSYAEQTDELVRTWDLDAVQPLPKAPWFPPNGTRSARRVFVHIVAETAQHAGHAD